MTNIFKDFVVGNELYVDEYNWEVLKGKYEQTHIIQQISDAIVEFEIKLPYREISYDEMVADYMRLLKQKPKKLSSIGAWGSKFEYKYDFNHHYVENVNAGNKASDYFHQIERWKCDATGYPSPQKTWETERFRLTLFKALFSLKVTEINPTILRNLISLRKYIAAQFRPSAAKYIYDFFHPEVVMDFSMGWGDRLLAAHASKSVHKYIGLDPNVNLFEGYVNQIQTYSTFGTGKKIDYLISPNRAEDFQTFVPDMVDLVFTSPPYFDKEKYDQGENQSYIRYKEFDTWLHQFLYNSIKLRTQTLKSGGYLVINISDIYTRKTHFKICDAMNDYIASTKDFEYYGAIGLRMPKRPMSKSSNTTGIYGEPIWVWKKK